MDAPLVVHIGEDGGLRWVDHPDLRCLATLGEARTARASHVEPINPILRVAFTVIRARVSDASRLAGWTRRWPCLWRANLAPSGGPLLGPFARRNDAIDAEVAWLNANL